MLRQCDKFCVNINVSDTKILMIGLGNEFRSDGTPNCSRYIIIVNLLGSGRSLCLFSGSPRLLLCTNQFLLNKTIYLIYDYSYYTRLIHNS